MCLFQCELIRIMFVFDNVPLVFQIMQDLHHLRFTVFLVDQTECFDHIPITEYSVMQGKIVLQIRQDFIFPSVDVEHDISQPPINYSVLFFDEKKKSVSVLKHPSTLAK